MIFFQDTCFVERVKDLLKENNSLEIEPTSIDIISDLCVVTTQRSLIISIEVGSISKELFSFNKSLTRSTKQVS